MPSQDRMLKETARNKGDLEPPRLGADSPKYSLRGQAREKR